MGRRREDRRQEIDMQQRLRKRPCRLWTRIFTGANLGKQLLQGQPTLLCRYANQRGGKSSDGASHRVLRVALEPLTARGARTRVAP